MSSNPEAHRGEGGPGTLGTAERPEERGEPAHARAAKRPAGASPIAIDLVWAIGITTVIMSLILAAGGIWTRQQFDDLHGQFLPKYEYAAKALLHDRKLPLWNPYEFCGSPLLASPQNLALYPPALLLFALLPLRPALQGLYAFHILVLSWASMTYLRHHHIHRGAAAFAPFVVVAQVFVAPGQLAVDHPNFLGSVCWVPLLLLCLERSLSRSVRWLAPFALAAAAQWFAGYPTFGLDTSVLLLIVAAVGGGASLPRRVLVTSAGLLLGGLIASIQLRPLLEAVAESSRGAGAVHHPVVRHLIRHSYVSSIVAPQHLAVLGIVAFGVRGMTRARLGWWAAWMWCMVALLPAFSLLYSLPGFAGVRFPVGWHNLGPVFASFLAAAGIAEARRRRNWSTYLVLSLSAVSLVQSAVIIHRMPAALRYPAPDYDLVARRVAVLRSHLDRLPVAPRLVSAKEIGAGATLRFRLPAATAFEPTMPQRHVLRLLDAIGIPATMGYYWRFRWQGIVANANVAALLGIGIVVVPQRVSEPLRRAGFTPLARLEGHEVAWYRAPVPRARLVHDVVTVGSEAEAFASTIANADAAQRVAIVEESVGDLDLTAPPPGSAERVEIVVDEPERVVVHVVAASPGLLVLHDTFFPGWTAFADGLPTPIFRANFAFRGVYVPAGHHEIAFQYMPRSFRVGAWVTACGILIVLGLLVLRRTPRIGTGRSIVTTGKLPSLYR